MSRGTDGNSLYVIPSAVSLDKASSPANTPASACFERLLVLPAILLILFVTVNPLANVDLWFHLKAGEWIVSTRSVPATDPFSFSASGHPWVVNAWLSEVVLWGVHHFFGPNGLILMTSALVLSIYGILLVLWRRMGADFSFGILILSTAVLAAAFRFTPRAELLGALLCSAMLFLIYNIKKESGVRGQGLKEERKDDKAWLFSALGSQHLALIGCLALWANVHMAFINGVVVLLIFLTGEFIAGFLAPRYPGFINPPMPKRALLRLTVFSVIGIAGTLLNPYGIQAWTYTTLVAASPVFRKGIEEWLPLLVPGSPINLVSLWCLGILIITYVISVYVRSRISVSTFLLVAFSLVSMLLVRRQAMLFSLVVPVALGEIWGVCAGEPASLPVPVRRWLPKMAGVGLLGTLLLLRLYGMGDWLPPAYVMRLGLSRPVNAVGAAEFIAANVPRGNLFNTLELGGCLIWRLWPCHKVSIDGRVDLYGEEVFKNHELIEYLGADWKPEFIRNHIHACVLGYVTTPAGKDGKKPPEHLAVRLSRDPHWHLVYWDDAAMVFLDDSPVNSEAIARHGYRFLNPVCIEALSRGVAESRFPEIIEEINRVLKQRPDQVTSHLMAAAAYRMMEMKHDSDRELRCAAGLDIERLFVQGTHSSVLKSVIAKTRSVSTASEGLALSRQGRYKEAIPKLEDAVKQKPRDPELHFHLGFAYSKIHKLEEAESEYRTAARLAPDKPEISYNLACVLACRKRPGEAIQCLHRALDSLPELVEQAESDPELASLSGDPSFTRLLSEHQLINHQQ